MRLNEVSDQYTNFVLKEGITHVDDQKVPVDKFLHVIKNLKNFEITEKVDGANLWFGLNEQGKLFTSRGAKEGGHFYNSEDWGNDFKDTGFKSAHAALKRQEHKFNRAGMNPGDIIEVEVLFGDKPNAIPYWPNQIIFLRPINGDPNIERIADIFDGTKTSIEIENVPFTPDGRSIEYNNEIHTWTFSKVKEHAPDIQKIDKELSKYIEELEDFLYEPNIGGLVLTNKDGEQEIPSNIEILALRATKNIKETKNKILDVVDGKRDPETGKRTGKDGLRYNIKNILLTELVRNAHSSIGPALEDGGWIEGLVFRRPGEEKDELWKLVDRDIFTSVNKFNHEIRGFLSDKHKGPETPREAAGFLGNLLRDMAKDTGHLSLGTIQAKRYMKKFGDTPLEIASELSKDMNVLQTKSNWSLLLKKAETVLENILEKYNKDYGKKEFIDALGRRHKYDKTIHQRTLQVFAKLFNQIDGWQTAINKAKSGNDLIIILVGDKLS